MRRKRGKAAPPATLISPAAPRAFRFLVPPVSTRCRLVSPSAAPRACCLVSPSATPRLLPRSRPLPHSPCCQPLLLPTFRFHPPSPATHPLLPIYRPPPCCPQSPFSHVIARSCCCIVRGGGFSAHAIRVRRHRPARPLSRRRTGAARAGCLARRTAYPALRGDGRGRFDA